MVAKSSEPQTNRTSASFTHHGSTRHGGTGAAGGGGGATAGGTDGGTGGLVETTCASMGIGGVAAVVASPATGNRVAPPFARRMPAQVRSARPTGVPVMEVGTPASRPSSRPLPRDLPQPSWDKKR
ncbi:MAG: hypothetical protein FJ406_07135 [Verrucomicrobia bacterium]|nr:hypothetical protein [Verrucomicrobiota bacterium]MBM3869852.1 hypothetical protein [Verrucomicrobiota bacterium]